MGGTQRLAAVAAVSHARHYYNNTAPEHDAADAMSGLITLFFASATLCGVLMMVCAACWRRKPTPDKPEDQCRGVYTVSGDSMLNQVQMDSHPGPPPTYESVIKGPTDHNKDCHVLEEVVTEPYPLYPTHITTRDNDLPSYEAAVLLKDTKL